MSSPYGGGGPWPAGYGYPPPGGPDTRNRNLAIAAAVGGVTAVLVVAVIVAAVLLHGTRGSSAHAASTSPSSTAANSVQTATACTPNVSGGEYPVNGVVAAGGLSFPAAVAAGWTARANTWMPNAVDAITLYQEVDSSGGWIADVTVAVTNFDQSMSLSDQAELMLECVLAGETYSPYSPETPEAASTTSGRIDGVETYAVDVAVPVSYAGITGDDVIVIIIDTHPSTVFLGISPIGDTARRAVVEAAVAGLHVAAD